MARRPGVVRIEIVTPVHNRRALTLGCLESIAGLSREGLDLHVVIVDDGSTDGTAEAIAAAHPEVEVIRGDGHLWFTEGTNVGVRRALERNPDFILMINDDQVFDAECVRHLVDTALAFPRSVVGSLLQLWDQPDRLFQTAPVWDTWRGGWRHWHHQSSTTVPDRPWTVDLIVGNCVLVPAAAFRECGLMDAKRFPNFGDAEFTPRLRKAGWRLVIDPRAVVRCLPNTPPASPRAMSWTTRLRTLLVDRGHPQNIRRRFSAFWHGAPTPLQGVVAFVMFFARWAVGRNIEGDWAVAQQEPPLRETFASRVLGGRQVIYAWNYVEWGGAQVYFLALMREAARHARVSALLPFGSHPQLLAALDQAAVPYEMAFPPIDGREAATIGRKIGRHLAKVRSEVAMVRALGRRQSGETVLHVDLGPWQSMAALWWLSRRSHVFVTCHTALARGAWWREVLWRKKLGVLAGRVRFHIFASNLDARERLGRLLPPAALERIAITYTGVNPEQIDVVRHEPVDAGAVRTRFALPPRAVLVVCVGQFIDRKGRWTFLDAAREVARTRDDIGFVWISNSAPSAGDRARAEAYGLGDAFRLLTSTDIGADHLDVFRLLRATDLFCLPTFVDGLPIALLEAMALGLPVIATPVFAIPEAVVDGETGVLVVAGDAPGLARAMVALADDPARRARLAEHGRAHVIARFDERDVARIAWVHYASAAGFG